MKKATLMILGGEVLLSAIIAFSSNNRLIDQVFFTIFGLCNLIIGLLGFFVALVIVIFNREAAKPVFLSSGIILLAGCLTCSIFPWGYN